MNRFKAVFGLLVLFALLLTGTQTGRADPPTVAPLGGSPMSGFTYQGALSVGGVPAQGVYDFLVSIYDAPSAGTRLADCNTTVTIDQTVERGLFTLLCIPTNFGGGATAATLFNGQARYIGVQVKANAASVYTVLPRQPINPAPYAMSLAPGATITDGYNTTASISTVNNSRYFGLFGTTTSTGTGAGQYGVGGFHGGVTIADLIPFYFWDAGGVFGGPNGIIALSKLSGGYGVVGLNTATGVDTSGYGGFFRSSTEMGAGVFAASTSSTAVRAAGIMAQASSPDSYGVIGTNGANSVLDIPSSYESGGAFVGQNGVVGVTKTSNGVAVLGYDVGTAGYGWAGAFFSDSGNGVYITSATGKVGLVVSGGSKSAVVPTSQGETLLYTEESSEVWFTEYGFGKLENGAATVAIDPLFAETVDLSVPYHVFVQVYGDAEVYVTNRGTTAFEVRLRSGDGGDPNVEFSYRLVATRKGFAGQRLEQADSEMLSIQQKNSVLPVAPDMELIQQGSEIR